jgi:hypothetical protein
MSRENFTKVRRTWLGLLNMVLAMSSMTAVTGGAKADVRIAESDIFYERGLGLCGNEILRGTTLEVGMKPWEDYHSRDGSPNNHSFGL